MCPRTSNSAVKVISAGLGWELRLRVVTNALAEQGVALEIKPSIVVLDEDVLGAPSPINELAHSGLLHCAAYDRAIIVIASESQRCPVAWTSHQSIGETAGQRQRQPSAGATRFRIVSTTWAL